LYAAAHSATRPEASAGPVRPVLLMTPGDA
jgi:hypothetical protein